MASGCRFDHKMNGSSVFAWSRKYLLVGLALLVSSCYWSGPWPRGTDYNRCLGQGQIADYLAANCCQFDEKWLIGRVSEMLRTAHKTSSPRESAQSIGMRCLASPSRICIYKGEKGWTVDNPPSDRSDLKKVHVEEILIVLQDYDDLTTLVVQTNERISP